MAQQSDLSTKQSSSSWFEAWFNHPLYLEVYSHRDQREAAQCIDTILSCTGLETQEPSSLTVLDIACGAGRHALELAKRGYRVTGNDLSPFLLEEARKAAEASKLPLDLTCSDMRHISTHRKYELVVQLFTSFGYFEEKEDDQRVLNNAYKVLRSGGWYVLDLLNPEYLRRTLVANSRRTAVELTIIEERSLQHNTITKTISIIPKKGESLTFSESVRLYDQEEISTMLECEGFNIINVVGTYQGDKFASTDSPRMMIFCRKV